VVRGTLTFETFNAIIDKEPSGPEEPAPGKYVGLAVRDTGMGISDDVLPTSSSLSSPRRDQEKGQVSDSRKSLVSPSSRVEASRLRRASAKAPR
jgi:hypothetical protein